MPAMNRPPDTRVQIKAALAATLECAFFFVLAFALVSATKYAAAEWFELEIPGKMISFMYVVGMIISLALTFKRLNYYLDKWDTRK